MVSKEQQYLDSYELFLQNITNMPKELIWGLTDLLPKQSILRYDSSKESFFPFFDRRKEEYLKYKPELFCILDEIQNNSGFASCLTEELYGIYLKYASDIKDFLKDKNNLPYIQNDFSSGTTKVEKIPFKKFFPIWGKDLEYVINQVCYRYYGISEKYRYRIAPTDNVNSSQEGTSTSFSHEILFNNYDNLIKLIDTSEKNIFMTTNPFYLHKMLLNKDIINLFKRIRPIISVSGYDCSGYDFSILKENNIPLVNQMTAWKEGTAFYTCPYNKFHWMENLFYCTPDKKVIDLFNFCNDWWDKEGGNPDNIWPLEQDFHQCECGTWYREMNFQPHAIKNIRNYKNELSNSGYFSFSAFKEKYEFFQIVQQKDGRTFHVHVSKEMNEHDYNYASDWIKKTYGKDDVIINVIYGLYSVGSRLKNPVFWSENVEFKKL